MLFRLNMLLGVFAAAQKYKPFSLLLSLEVSNACVRALAYRRAAALHRITGLSAEWPLSRIMVVIMVSAIEHGLCS